jgi:iron-sulfur cluster assembly protein
MEADANATIIELTPKAVSHIQRTMSAEGVAGHGLRIAVITGGCSGNEYSLTFAAEPTAGDLVYQAGELRVFVDQSSADKLAGTVLDYVDGLYGAGLKFRNPRAVHSCGCGSSFSTE